MKYCAKGGLLRSTIKEGETDLGSRREKGRRECKQRREWKKTGDIRFLHVPRFNESQWESHDDSLHLGRLEESNDGAGQ